MLLRLRLSPRSSLACGGSHNAKTLRPRTLRVMRRCALYASQSRLRSIAYALTACDCFAARLVVSRCPRFGQAVGLAWYHPRPPLAARSMRRRRMLVRHMLCRPGITARHSMKITTSGTNNTTAPPQTTAQKTSQLSTLGGRERERRIFYLISRLNRAHCHRCLYDKIIAINKTDLRTP